MSVAVVCARRQPVKVARVRAVMLMFAGVMGGMQNAPAAHRLLAAPEASVASGFCEGPFSLSFRPPTRAAGLFPSAAAPAFNRQADWTGSRLSMTSEGGGVIYFTRNGADPRVPGTGEMATGAQAYAEALTVRGAARVKARVLKDRVWRP